MTRVVLCMLLGVSTLAGGLYTAWIACQNHACARDLDRVQREIEEATALRTRLRARVDAHVAGRPDTPPVEERLKLPLLPYPGPLAEVTR